MREESPLKNLKIQLGRKVSLIPQRVHMRIFSIITHFAFVGGSYNLCGLSFCFVTYAG